MQTTQPNPSMNVPTGVSAPPSTTLQYKNFWVRYFLRETGHLVYQFFTIDPKFLDDFGKTPKHVAFPQGFKELLIKVFQKHIPFPEKLDIAYVADYEGVRLNSFSVIARGYAKKLNVGTFLEPIFEELDTEVAHAT